MLRYLNPQVSISSTRENSNGNITGLLGDLNELRSFMYSHTSHEQGTVLGTGDMAVKKKSEILSS